MLYQSVCSVTIMNNPLAECTHITFDPLLVSRQPSEPAASIRAMVPGNLKRSTCSEYFPFPLTSSSLLVSRRLSFVLYQHPPRLRAEDSSSHQEQTPPHYKETSTLRSFQRHRRGSGLPCGGVSVHTGTTATRMNE